MWLWRFVLSFALLNALWTFENRWPGFGVHAMPRLSFELCLGVVALMGWVAWRGRLTGGAATVWAMGFVALMVVRYANVTAPAVLGRPVNVYWDGRHAVELLQLATQSLSTWQVLGIALGVALAAMALLVVVRHAIRVLAQCVVHRRPRPWLAALVAALSLSFVAYEPGQRDTRWFFSLPMTPTLAHQGQLLARVWWPEDGASVLDAGPAFDGDLSGLVGARGPADVLLVFAESYGAGSFDQPAQAAALAEPRAALQAAIDHGGRAVVSARVTAPTFGGASWLSHAGLLAGVDTRDPADHDLLLASQRPTLVRHFAQHGYRTVGWMPGIKRAWPEGTFYGFDRLADDAGIGYQGPDFGYWRIPDQAAMALLHAQELDVGSGPFTRAPRFVVFPTTSTHAPFHPLAPFVEGASRHTGPHTYTPEEAAQALAAPTTARQLMAPYLQSLRYQHAWLADYLRQRSQRPLVMVIVGDHQPPALVSGPGASWEVPVHVVADDPALLQRLLGSGFVPGLTPSPETLGPLHELTRVLLAVFNAPGSHEQQGMDHVGAPVTAPHHGS